MLKSSRARDRALQSKFPRQIHGARSERAQIMFREISIAPNCARCGVSHCVSSKTNFFARKRSTNATSAIFEASVHAMKHRFAEKRAADGDAVKSAGEFASLQASTECA